MRPETSVRTPGMVRAPLRLLALPLVAVILAGCSKSPAPAVAAAPGTSGPVVAPNPTNASRGIITNVGAVAEPTIAQNTSPYHPSPDPRVGLKAGNRATGESAWGEAAWNMKLISNTPSSEKFVGVTNSDLAFTTHYAIQGNYNGFQIWDIANPAKPALVLPYYCPASQSDVSVRKNLLFVSAEGAASRVDCGGGGVPEPVSKDRVKGIRVFDISDIRNPKYVTNVQTCRGSHTHTLVSDLKDDKNVYIYVSGTSGVRPTAELDQCIDAPDDPNTARFRLEVIKVPLAAPDKAAIVGAARVFAGIDPAPQKTPAPAAAAAPPAAAAAAGGRGGRGTAPRTGPNQCHDITTYPAIGFAGGACNGYGILLDVRDPANPKRISAVSDTNFSTWHSATFSNDGSKVMFTDEWGGGSNPRCRATDNRAFGSDAIFTIENRTTMRFKSYYKLPAPQTDDENCVAHNGSPIPIPGREVLVQGWYQGGITILDWTDPAHAYEIAFFDRGPLSPRTMSGGSWSAYWYNGVIVSSEINRGLDIFELSPSPMLSQNEIDAARTVHLDELNAQEQPHFVYPPSFPLSKAYLDQLERSKGLPAARLASIRSDLALAEQANGTARKNALSRLATSMSGDGGGSSDKAKVALLLASVKDLAAKP